MGTQPASKPIVENWENEGGSVSAQPGLESLGITRFTTETYAVGGYSYTNLTDALAQGRRMQTQAAAE